MKGSLDNHLSKLYVYPSRSAYMLSSDIDMRACCKSMRERLKRLLPTVDHHTVWVRVEGGVLLIVAGPHIITRVLLDMFAGSKHLYSGSGRKIIRELVQDALATGYVPVGQRSYGASR
ncbi:GGDEF_2 domain-containing protein [Pseudomonas serbica]